MVSETTQTSTSSTAPSNKDVNSLVSKLSKGLAGEYTPGQSLYQAPGANTVAGQDAALSAAGNPLFSSGVNGALADFGDIAAGNRYGTDDPGYAALRAKVANDTLTGINSSFNNSGLLGSDSNLRAAGEGLGNALAGLDYSNFQNDQQRQLQAAGLLPTLFQDALLPSSIQQSVGAAQDADAAAKASGKLDYLSRLIASAQGAAGASGSTTTSVQPGTPLWQSLAGGAIGLAGLL